MREHFPRKVPGDSLSHDHVNDLSTAAERIGRFVPGTGMIGSQIGNSLHMAGFSPWEQHIVEIIEESDTANIYDVYLRWYSPTNSLWKNDTNKIYKLDASDFGVDLEDRTKLVAFWDDQRGMFVPVVPPAPINNTGGMSIIIKTPLSGIPARSTNQMGYAVCLLLATNASGLLEKIGSIGIWNVVDVAIGECKICKADPVTTSTGSVIYVLDVESCVDIELEAGACPDDGIADNSPGSNFSRRRWDGAEWVLVDAQCGAGQIAVSPPDAGLVGEIVDTPCSTDASCWEADIDAAGNVTGSWNLTSLHGACTLGTATPPTYPAIRVGQLVCLKCPES